MKIEKISDNQIRCILTQKDLAEREIKFSELAYGSDKAKTLFHDMMFQAATEFGFETNDIPLMIEAIPLSADSIILIITKVEDPEELDTRFAKFSQADTVDTSDSGSSLNLPKSEGADGILGLFNKLRDSQNKLESDSTPTETIDENKELHLPINLTRLYKFPHLDAVMRVARILTEHYNGSNSLYKDDSTKEYHLIISKSDHSPEIFNKICNILSEYGTNQNFTTSIAAFYAEHMECIIANEALQKLSQI